MPQPKLVIIESPYAGDPDTVEEHLAYARMCCLDSFHRGEYPFASHLLYPQMLDDTEPMQRKLGMSAGFAWGSHADLVAVYCDRGISCGMQSGIDRAIEQGIPVIFRRLGVGDFIREEKNASKVSE